MHWCLWRFNIKSRVPLLTMTFLSHQILDKKENLRKVLNKLMPRRKTSSIPSSYRLSCPSVLSRSVIWSLPILRLWSAVESIWDSTPGPALKLPYIGDGLSVCTSNVTVAVAVTLVTVELDAESDSIAIRGGVLLWLALLLPWLPRAGLDARFGRVVESITGSDHALSSMKSWESVGGVPRWQLELGRSSRWDPQEDEVPGGRMSSTWQVIHKSTFWTCLFNNR